VRPAQAQYILGLGGNLGDRAAIIAEAIKSLHRLPNTEVLRVSPAYETKPVGYGPQPDFINLCAALSSALEPEALLAGTLAIEAAAGRVRSPNRDGPRTLDIDLLFHRGGNHASATLTLPHPRWKSRGFVVIPLGQLLDDAIIVGDAAWDSLRHEVAALTMDATGLRAWQGPTPWITKTG